MKIKYINIMEQKAQNRIIIMILELKKQRKEHNQLKKYKVL